MRIALKYAWLAGVTLFLACAGLVPVLQGSEGDQYNLPVHNLHSGNSFKCIQDAISDSETRDGHVLSVVPGTYKENVEITKVLTIRSASGNPSDTVVQAKNTGVPVFRLMLNGITLTGFGVQGSSRASGIQVYASENCQVLNNKITGNYHGIYINHGSKNTFRGNTVESNKVHGFFVASSKFNTITGNFANSNGTPGKGNGFYLYFSDQCTVEGNTASRNGGSGISLHEANDNIIKDNLIESNTTFGIQISKSSNATLIGNVISGSGSNFDVVGDRLAHYKHQVNRTNTSDGKPIEYEVVLPDDLDGDQFEEPDAKHGKDKRTTFSRKGAGMLLVDRRTLSRRKGGTVNFSLKAGFANRTKQYLLLGSLSGTHPGTPLPGGRVTLPLNWDSFTTFTVAFMNTHAFSKFMGKLDSRGEASALFRTMGPLPPDMVGLTFSFAYALKDMEWDGVSYPVDIKIKP